ncbi:MAG TPA: GntR family transcriptional regulator, partial [Paralcaligenes sp.]
MSANQHVRAPALPNSASHGPSPFPLSPSGSEVVDRLTLPTSIANRLRELIIQGELQAGMRLNERALCDRLGV